MQVCVSLRTNILPGRPRLYGQQNGMETTGSVLTDHINVAGVWMVKENFGLSLKSFHALEHHGLLQAQHAFTLSYLAGCQKRPLPLRD